MIIEIACVDLKGGSVRLQSGQTVPIVNMLDSDGDECLPSAAMVVVAMIEHERQDLWFTVDLRQSIVGMIN